MDEKPIPANLWHVFVNAIRSRKTGRFFVELEGGVVTEGGFEDRIRAKREDTPVAQMVTTS